jgi:hypothetical protein
MGIAEAKHYPAFRQQLAKQIDYLREQYQFNRVPELSALFNTRFGETRSQGPSMPVYRIERLPATAKPVPYAAH